MVFMAAATIAPIFMVFGCGVVVGTFPYRFTLLNESLVFIGSAEDQHEMTPMNVLVHHPKGPLPLWHAPAGLF